ncbi:putative mis12 domain protein [Lasiodiplodia theobromae]|uniref:Kinetochore-associated protein MTW1 n=1 Tax=Lasiodiplodia theobromae TaxID=45133 RepID=A0A5N5DI79_9PEZI|nr:Mis12 domain-containing protein [Lasiodiplodia theobromae]KAB2577588.1 Kinetochore-associated protein MTW1 [Lasiodiplodia theobromae]KAF4535568.1 Mis12 domain-containing protein [Lasiodiplodia theobromae]KAF9638855.1 putative mis12 domain protein [Lasiodiplodia theobromae]
MAQTKQIETSLLTEHFRYTPLTLIDQIINMINELINRAVDAVEAGLLETPPSRLGFAARAAAENTIPDTDGEGNPLFPDARKEIEEGVHQLETLLEATVDKNFDKLEIYLLRNVLTVPEDLVPWVRLAHYQDLQLPNTSTSSSTPLPTPESVQALRRKVQETNKLHTALLAEKARNEALLTQLRGLLGGNTGMKTEPASSPQHTSDGPAPTAAQNPSLAFLASAPAAQNLGISLPTDGTAALPRHEPLRQNTAFALSQLPALRQILQNLRPKIAALGTAGGAGPESEFAKQRSEYVEKRTKRIMERKGMDVGSGEGSSEGLGRRMLPEEVKGMEAVAGLVGEKTEGGENGEQMQE